MLDLSRRREPTPVLWGALLGAGVAGAASFWHVRRLGEHARRLHRTLVDLLLNALTADDSATARHSRRVADLTDALAGALRLGREDRATLRVGALLHDLGKVDDRYFDILHSRGQLTPEQRAQMQTHPWQSAHILEPLEKFHPGIKDVVSSHHECWNGEGYPRGLEGEEIPLGGRIIAMADVFDALTQPRTYHAPVPPEDVLGKLRDGAGTHFDPELVKLLDRPEVWRRWEEIARRGLREEEEASASAAAPSAPRAGGAG
jgi:putative nucleotidyltransferase with HDIG domain